MTRFKAKQTVWILLAFLSFEHLFTQGVIAAEEGPKSIALENLMPPNTMLLLRLPNFKGNGSSSSPTLLSQSLEHPEATEFIDELTLKWEQVKDKILENTEIQRSAFQDLLESQISFAFLGLDVLSGRASTCLSFHLPKHIHESAAFELFKELARKRISVNIPAQMLNHSGKRILHLPMPGANHLFIQEHNYFVFLEQHLLFSNSLSVIQQAIDRYLDRGLQKPNLAHNPLFKNAKNRSGEQPNGGFLYVNTGLTIPLLKLVLKPQANQLIETLGLSSTKALAISAVQQGEGYQHTIYLRTGEHKSGILKIFRFELGAEKAAPLLSQNDRFLFSARASLLDLYKELPILIRQFSSYLKLDPNGDPTGLLSLAGRKDYLGIPIQEILAALGDQIILQSGDCGIAARFPSAHIPSLNALVRRMEQSSGLTATSLPEGNYVLRYFAQLKTPLPLAPSYLILDNTSVLLATHPQVIKSILRKPYRRGLHHSLDFQRSVSGMPEDLGMLLYVNSSHSFGRVYNATLPFLNLLNTYPQFELDPGLLPPAPSENSSYFGFALGAQSDPDGVTITAFSPLGVGGPILYILDRMIVSNPATMGLATAALHRLFTEDRALKSPAAPVISPPKPVAPQAPTQTDWDE